MADGMEGVGELPEYRDREDAAESVTAHTDGVTAGPHLKQ